MFKQSIAKKLAFMAGTVMLITGGALIYLASEIRQSETVINGVIDEQAQILERLARVHAAAKKFDDLRFWLTDLSVSWQNESEANAEVALTELTSMLAALEASDKSLTAAVGPQIQQYQVVMIEAVDAYVDENRVLGNSKVAEGREFVRSVDEQFRQASEKVDALARSSTGTLLQNNSALLITALVALAAAILIGGLITTIITRTITRPIAYG